MLALIAFTALLVVGLLLVAVATDLYLQRISGGNGLGWFFLTIVRAQEDIGTTFSVALVVISAGLTVLSSRNSHGWLLYIDCMISVAALCAGFAIYIMLWDANGDRARLFWYEAVPEISPETFLSATQVFLGCIAGWYGGFLVSQLGIGRRAAEGLGGKVKAVLDWLRPGPQSHGG
jgi:hypothetical protein